ncbi:hypothetical protein, partial [Mycobacterium sp. DL99]|uniref:hypothetical protein n=1 Tax=Mycobacterium sp. DL99 TaxID=2528957 RepID=UPI001AEC3EB4
DTAEHKLRIAPHFLVGGDSLLTINSHCRFSVDIQGDIRCVEAHMIMSAVAATSILCGKGG